MFLAAYLDNVLLLILYYLLMIDIMIAPDKSSCELHSDAMCCVNM